jgi:DNA polymerase III gamma/tau subunit
MLLSLVRDLTVFQAGGHDTQLMHRDIQDALSSLAASLPAVTVWKIFDLIHETQEAMAHNVNPQIALEVMLFKIGDAYERARRRDGQRQRYAPA